ncbi:hypothetical protein AVEN_77163-1 [Araneus ventricosus]|uniref:Uncharacterized protein n=1 Tax=Araneus ventricosus TaxID=182803 RepID=A0A4Y2IDQ9_ARAVE|nr:hypothetical protein AVEN_77163-1 [Araneus ventricosus]
MSKRCTVVTTKKKLDPAYFLGAVSHPHIWFALGTSFWDALYTSHTTSTTSTRMRSCRISSESVQMLTSLYWFSLGKTAELLTRGVWSTCAENPFETFAPDIVEDLLALASSQQYAAKLSDLKLLIQTGRFRKLELHEFIMDEDQDLFPVWLSENVCKKLKVLKILPSLKRHNIEAILDACVNLEEFHSSMLVGFGAMKNCRKLRSWKVHLSNNDPNFLAYETPDFPESLKNLERFSVCNEYPCFFLYKKLATVLENCPKLTSVGMGDSAVALKFLKQSNPGGFGLKRCHWGSSFEIVSQSVNPDFFDLIRNAVEAFPLVEELDLVVFDDSSLQCLMKLKHLNCLSIHSCDFSETFLSQFFHMLSRIGHQLRHLFLEDRNYYVPIEDILLYCPNLETLRMEALVAKPRELDYGLLRLKRLLLTRCNKEVLMLLLFNCKDLEELYISNARCLRDDLLELILDANPLSNLKIVSLDYCTLTEDGLRMIFQSAVSLQTVHFACGVYPPRTDYDESVSYLINELNLKIVNYLYGDLEEKSEFFRRKFSWCSF